MLITKLHTLIRSRTLWWFFTMVVCISFIGGFSHISGCYGSSSRIAGVLFGRKITVNEFQAARFFEAGAFRRRDISAEDIARINRQTWKRLAILELARQWGVKTSQTEVQEDLMRDSTFAPDGTFDPNRFRQIIAELPIASEIYMEFPGQSELEKKLNAYLEYRRQNITLSKMANILQAGVFTHPAELNRQITNITDIITTLYVLLNTSHVSNITVTLEDAKQFFDEHKELFRIPEQVSVKYVAFPISNYIGSVTVSQFAVSEYYSNNLPAYAVTNTNGVVYTPLEMVNDSIVATLKWNLAVSEAKNAASDFEMLLVPDQYGRAMAFEEAAAKFKLNVQTSHLFSAYEVPTNLDVGYDFTKIAFKLDPTDPQGYFSTPILGKHFAYIISTNQKVESRLPEFKEVEDRVLKLALQEARRKALFKKVREIRETSLKKLETGKSFAEIMAELNLNVSTTRPFNGYEETMGGTESSETNKLPYSSELVQATMSLGKGELSQPVEVEDGLLLVYVAERVPGDSTIADSIRPSFRAMLDRGKTMLLFDNWCEHVLRLSNLEDRLSKVAVE